MDRVQPRPLNSLLYQLREVCKSYGPSEQYGGEALRNIHLDIHAGEFLVITGRSGSGKSSLLHILGGLDRPNSGEVTLCISGGFMTLNLLNEDERAHIRRSHIGMIYQSFELVPTMTIWENVALPLMFDGRSGRERKATASNWLDRLGLSGRANSYPKELSGGQQQRVAIARALATDPCVLLADEPTGNLDSESGRDVIDILRALNERDGKTVVMVTHDSNIVKTVTKRVISLKDGCLET